MSYKQIGTQQVKEFLEAISEQVTAEGKKDVVKLILIHEASKGVPTSTMKAMDILIQSAGLIATARNLGPEDTDAMRAASVDLLSFFAKVMAGMWAAYALDTEKARTGSGDAVPELSIYLERLLAELPKELKEPTHAR